MITNDLPIFCHRQGLPPLPRKPTNMTFGIQIKETVPLTVFHSPLDQVLVGAPTMQFSFLCPYTNQHSDLANSSLTTTANHSLIPSFSVYFHKQRKWPLTNGTTFWKPRPSALPTSQWQSRLTNSDLYKRSHLTGEKRFIWKGVTVQNTMRRKLCKTHQDRRPDCPATMPRGLGTPPFIPAYNKSKQPTANNCTGHWLLRFTVVFISQAQQCTQWYTITCG